jgi:branched-chain amino acid transport system ATP-binding protein
VRDNLRIGRGPVEAAMEVFPQLKPLTDRKAGLLSGGEQQMLALGRALAGRPKVLLIDELSLGLAPIIVRRLLEAVKATAESGVGVLLVEQFAHRALEIASRAYVMTRGQIVHQASGDGLVGLSERLEGFYLSSGADAHVAPDSAPSRQMGAAPESHGVA